jgi:DNA-binding GntR family transcriptional regulator
MLRLKMTTVPGEASGSKNGRIKRSHGLVDAVYAIIRADIMSLKIPPDTRISVDNLARELGVSQTPIREALSILEANGLVSKKHLVGYCTAPKLSRKQLEELYHIRLLIEPFTARRAAERMSDEELDKLRTLMQSADGPPPSYNLIADQDREFHEIVARGSGNDLMEETLGKLHTHVHILRLNFHRGGTAEAVAEHLLVMQALQRRNPGEAETAMREHIEKSYQRLIPFVENS